MIGQVKAIDCLQIDILEIQKQTGTLESKAAELEAGIFSIQKKLNVIDNLRARLDEVTSKVTLHIPRIEEARSSIAALTKKAAALAEGVAAAHSSHERHQAAIAADAADRDKFQNLLAFELEATKTDVRAYAAALGGFRAAATPGALFLGAAVPAGGGSVDRVEHAVSALETAAKGTRQLLDQLAAHLEETAAAQRRSAEEGRLLARELVAERAAALERARIGNTAARAPPALAQTLPRLLLLPSSPRDPQAFPQRPLKPRSSDTPAGLAGRRAGSGRGGSGSGGGEGTRSASEP